jgi:tRNA dimethylallyltransferase
MLIYRHMDIGTAKPVPEDRNGIKHHLMDLVDPDQYYSAADYGRAARKVIGEIISRGGQPVMVGGSGLYVKAAIEGIFEGPSADRELRARLEAEAEEKGSVFLHDKLAEVDPRAASRINPRDLRRIVRALEVYRLTGRPISSFFTGDEQKSRPYKTLIYGLHREKEELHRRIHKRIDDMMERGWLQEVEKLLAMGYSTQLVSTQSFGYKRLAACLNGELELQEALELIKRDTRRFAKRQMTWFRKMKNVRWINLSELPGDEDSAADLVLKGLRSCAKRS